MKHFLILGLMAITLLNCKSNNNEDNGIPFPCKDGMAEDLFACSNVDLYARLSTTELLGNSANDIWGWTDPSNGKEYAIVGLTDGVTFVDVSDPADPIVLGKLSEEVTSKVKSDDDDEGKGESAWRDIKTYQNVAYVVTDAQPHGMQVFDLTKLRDVTNPPVTFSRDNIYTNFGKAHNIAINEETGYAYAVGTNTYGGGLHIIDLQDPLNPVFAGFHSDSTVGRNSTGYVHDTQCVIYNGPDTDHTGKEICMNASETHLVIADVSDKSLTSTISKITYESVGYAHQGWLTEDHSYFLLDDELDELYNGNNTTTYIFDVRDLDNPQLINTHVAQSLSIDHNLYIHENKVYQSNYSSGLRIMDATGIASGSLTEIGYFDTFPEHDNGGFQDGFSGSWSNYPFFDSGTIIVSDRTIGLFILKAELD